MGNLGSSSLRFAERYVTKSGFERYGGRATQECPRASLFRTDFPSRLTDGAQGLYQAVQDGMLPDQLTVDTHRVLAGAATYETCAVRRS